MQAYVPPNKLSAIKKQAAHVLAFCARGKTQFTGDRILQAIDSSISAMSGSIISVERSALSINGSIEEIGSSIIEIDGSV